VLVANPITLVMACSGSFGMTDPGQNGLDTMTVYERWTYRVNDPEPGDKVVARHPRSDGDVVGEVISADGDTVTIEGHGPVPPGESVSPLETVQVPRREVEGRPIGSLVGTSNPGRATVVFVAPWVAGFAMLLVAVSWAERLRRRHDGSSWWWPLPVLLWGIGTLFYAWRMDRVANRENLG
jgi:hypothetical protein